MPLLNFTYGEVKRTLDKIENSSTIRIKKKGNKLMHITINKPNKLKNMLDTATNKVSNMFTIVVLYLANISKIKALQRYSDRLATKRINKLKHQIIQSKWELDSLNKAIDCIEKSTH